VYDVKYKI